MDQTPRSDFPAKRSAGDTNIDLWTDGALYLENPITKKAPLFRDLRGLLCFVGDGANGLLGYANSLSSANESTQQCEELVKLAELLTEAKCRVEAKFELERATHQLDRDQFQQYVSVLDTCHQDTNSATHAYIQRLKTDISSHITEEATTAYHLREAERVKGEYEEQILDLKSELLKTKNHLTLSVRKCERLSKPQWHKAGDRQRKDLSNLAKGGGRAKRVTTMVR